MGERKAEFVERSNCISCGSDNLAELSGGSFREETVRNFIENDPWGVSPIPFIEHESWCFVRCNACLQMFQRRVLTDEWNDIRFSEWMDLSAMMEFGARLGKTDAHFKKGQEYSTHILRIHEMTRQLRGDNPTRILDFGCGGGNFLLTCEKYGFQACGIDRAPTRTEQAQGRILIHPDLDSLQSTDEGSEKFHAITLFEVLEHLDNPLGILKALSDLLVPGGILVLETPDCTGVSDIQSLHDFRCIHPLDHINAFTPATLSNIAGNAGFSPVKREASYVTADKVKAAKISLRWLLDGVLKSRTQQYFRKT